MIRFVMDAGRYGNVREGWIGMIVVEEGVNGCHEEGQSVCGGIHRWG